MPKTVPKTLDDKIKRVIEFIGMHMERESGWLYPDPNWNIEVVGLLDEIATIYGVEKQAVGEIINPIRVVIEAKNKAEDVENE